jgi:alkanesulfonate monooxygenase SsuD/methylene tetrahydromethanopterin reductase-like flavin-dependent oxidoreductase (luciferase family)
VSLWHLGALAPNYGSGLSLGSLDACASEAESLGYDSLWVTDHVVVPDTLGPTYGRIAEALVTVGYLAAQTTRIHLGVSALVVPQRQLLLTLKQVMTAQFLSGGRLLLAIAAGWTDQEFANLGAQMTERRSSLDRWEALVDAVVANGPGRIDLDLPGLQVLDATIAPGFVDGLAPPTWIAGHARGPLRRAARAGIWHPVGRSLPVVRELAEGFRVACPDGHIVLRVSVQVTDQVDADALDQGGRCRIQGPASFVVEQLRQFQAVGVDGFVVDLLAGDGSLSNRLAHFSQEVRPYLS